MKTLKKDFERQFNALKKELEAVTEQMMIDY